MKNFRLQIVTPKGIYKDVEVEMLNVATTAGQIGIYANHIPLASVLTVSTMNYIQNGKREYFAISGGFVYIGEKETTIIANTIEAASEIDENRAQKAKERAEKRKASNNPDIDMARAELALKRAINRINSKNTQV